MKITNVRRIGKNSLIAGFTADLNNGMSYNDLTLHCSNGKYWVGIPSKPILENGAHATDRETGKLRYGIPFLTFASRELADRFRDAVLAALREQHPDLFDSPVAQAATASVVPLRAEIEAAGGTDRSVPNVDWFS